MTRGKIAVITPDGDILTSVEFNGGMYIETGGLGQEVFTRLNLIETVKEYTALVKMFNIAADMPKTFFMTHRRIISI